MKRSLRNYLLTGVAVLLPAAATVFVLWKLFSLVDGFAGKLVSYFTPYHIPGLGVVITVLIILLVGVLATNVIGKRLLAYWEALVFRIPLVNTIYRTAKEIVDTFSEERKQVFRQVVLVEFPRRGSWVVGFLVGEAGESFRGATGQELVKVLIPHVPVPMSGFLLLVPKEEVIFLDLSVEEGLRFMVSTGIIEPGGKRGGNNVS
ncbi:DUF502 domain-containing protein [Ammonifex thiophilus]|uniref:DUF502 domain-containing protein n=2 Tax=Ammonifex thiophilus TaxID=444093 RepID=A0A3D8P6I4_9THEO|nr:DUF502 domain-containing protein [Ammonifex thiophilus]